MEHDHVGLVERTEGPGADARELVPAERVSDREWRIVATPGLVNGCAAGDRVCVDDDGTFEVIHRGGNLAAHIYSSVALAEAELVGLRQAFAALGGTVEWPQHQRFAVVTVPVVATFAAVEALLDPFVAVADDAGWNFGNVFDADGVALGWWTA